MQRFCRRHEVLLVSVYARFQVFTAIKNEMKDTQLDRCEEEMTAASEEVEQRQGEG